MWIAYMYIVSGITTCIITTCNSTSLPLHPEHSHFTPGSERCPGADSRALWGRQEEVYAASRVREPDKVRWNHLALFQVLSEATGVCYVQVCLLPLLQVQEGECLRLYGWRRMNLTSDNLICTECEEWAAGETSLQPTLHTLYKCHNPLCGVCLAYSWK